MLKNENLRADYLLNKNGHSWERKGANRYNDVNADFRSSAQKAAGRESESFLCLQSSYRSERRGGERGVLFIICISQKSELH